MSTDSARVASKQWWRRPWVWIVAAIGVAIVISNALTFPGGRYECIWQGERPEGVLGEGELVVIVGQWPGTYPLDARVYTTTQGMVHIDSGWTHAHSTYAREFEAMFPSQGGRYQAHCELP